MFLFECLFYFILFCFVWVTGWWGGGGVGVGGVGVILVYDTVRHIYIPYRRIYFSVCYFLLFLTFTIGAS